MEESKIDPSNRRFRCNVLTDGLLTIQLTAIKSLTTLETCLSSTKEGVSQGVEKGLNQREGLGKFHRGGASDNEAEVEGVSAKPEGIKEKYTSVGGRSRQIHIVAGTR